MKKILFAAIVLAPLFLSAQKKDVQVKYANTITPADLKNLLYTIAGPEMEGRGTATPGLVKAANYIADKFKSFGLQPNNSGTYFYNYPLYKDSVTENIFELNGEALVPATDFTIGQSANFSFTMGYSSFIFLGAMVDTTVNLDKLGLRGKCAVISDSYYQNGKEVIISNAAIMQKAGQLQAKGVATIIVISSKLPKAQQGGRGFLRVNKYGSSISMPVYYISYAAANKLMNDSLQSYLNKMASGTLKTKNMKADIGLRYSRVQTETPSINVAAVIEGTDKKDEWVIITAHMDHLGKRDTVIYYGADDDGSGSCAVMEIAEAFAMAKKDGKGPRRSMLFMTVSGEEMGLLGSEAYTKKPIYPLKKASVDLNIDMIGRIDNDYLKKADSSNYVYIIGDDKLSSDLFPITEQANKYVKLNLDRRYNDVNDPNRFYFRSDHYNFADKGVPIIFYFNGVHKDYHRPTDTPDKISYELYAKRARLVFYTAWEMANREEMLKRDIPLPELSR